MTRRSPSAIALWQRKHNLDGRVGGGFFDVADAVGIRPDQFFHLRARAESLRRRALARENEAGPDSLELRIGFAGRLLIKIVANRRSVGLIDRGGVAAAGQTGALAEKNL